MVDQLCAWAPLAYQASVGAGSLGTGSVVGGSVAATSVGGQFSTGAVQAP